MKRTTVVLLMVILVLSIFTLYGCPKSADVSSAPESQPQKADAAATDAAKAADEKKAAEDAAAAKAAAAAKKYLTDLGVAGKRISLISYGKEKPVCRESTEDCWQKNRRAELVAAQ